MEIHETYNLKECTQSMEQTALLKLYSKDNLSTLAFYCWDVPKIYENSWLSIWKRCLELTSMQTAILRY